MHRPSTAGVEARAIVIGDLQEISLEAAALIALANGFLDAFTFVGHGRVFANAQSGNVILFGVGLARPDLAAPLGHLWPVLAFILGILVARVLRERATSGPWRDPRVVVLTLQTLVLVVIALLPTGAPQWTITASIGFASALQLSSFRTVHFSTFVPIAMTGNLMRITEALADAWEGVAKSQAVAALYAALIVTFVAGAALGALATTHLHAAAAWIPAGLFLLSAALMLGRRAGD